jgi:RNA polymerase sigma factor (sigma-70 family)
MGHLRGFLAGFGTARDAHAPDGELLARFRLDRDEGAFAELVRRHGPMVFAACRRVLTRWHDAEDAFQAAFLVLACKPDAPRPPERVGAWLHGVACRIAQQARRGEQRRVVREARAGSARPAASSDSMPDELPVLIDSVLLGLPERYRAAVVLCDLEGRSRKDAAAQLGWSEGLLSGRLARARKLLADRLARRGVALPLGAALAAFAPPAALARELTVSTLAATRLVRGGLDALPTGPVTALAHEVTRSMLPHRFGLFAALLGVGLCSAAFTSPLLPTSAATPPGTAAAPLAARVARPARADPPKPAPTWKERCRLKQNATVTALVAGPADRLYVGDSKGSVVEWDVRAERERSRLADGATAPKESAIDALALHPDGKWVYVINEDRKNLYSMFHHERREWLGNGLGGAKFFGSLPDGRALITGDLADDKRIVFRSHEFPKNTAAVPPDLKHAAAVRLVAAGDAEVVATVTADATVHAWDTGGGKLLWSTAVEKLDPTALAVSPGGKEIAVGGKDGVVRVFDGKTGKVVRRLAGHDGIVHAVVFSGDGKKLVTAGADKTVRVWNPATGKETAALKGHADAVRCALVSSDGELIVSGSADETVRVWELKP